MIKSFRGLLGHGLQQTINLHTNDGKTGYRIVKFQVIDKLPGNEPLAVDVEIIMKIYKVSQGTIDGEVNFSDNTLLGVVYYQGGTLTTETNASTIIFDKEIFNQDIFVTCHEGGGSLEGNYFIELEQVPLDLNESTVATLQSIRNA